MSSLFDRLAVSTLPFVPKPIVQRFAARYVAGDSERAQSFHCVKP